MTCFHLLKRFGYLRLFAGMSSTRPSVSGLGSLKVPPGSIHLPLTYPICSVAWFGIHPNSRRNPKGWFPKGWFWRMFPRNETGTRVRSDVPPERKTGTRVRSHVLPERKPERGYIRQNHPFTKPPFYLLVKFQELSSSKPSLQPILVPQLAFCVRARVDQTCGSFLHMHRNLLCTVFLGWCPHSSEELLREVPTSLGCVKARFTIGPARTTQLISQEFSGVTPINSMRILWCKRLCNIS